MRNYYKKNFTRKYPNKAKLNIMSTKLLKLIHIAYFFEYKLIGPGISD